MLPTSLQGVVDAALRLAPAITTDFTGRTLYASGVAKIAGFRFGGAGLARAVLLPTDPSVELEISDSLFALDGMTGRFLAAVHIDEGGGGLVLRRVRMEGAAMAYVASFGRRLVIEDAYLGGYGLNSQPDGHLEAGFIGGGRFEARRSLFDAAAGSGARLGGQTGPLYLEGKASAVDAVIEGCVFRGVKAVAAPASIQVCSRNHPVRLEIGGAALERGTSAYISVTEMAGPVTIIDRGGNVDAQTGEPINLAYPKAAPGAEDPEPTPAPGPDPLREALAARTGARLDGSLKVKGRLIVDFKTKAQAAAALAALNA